MSDEEVIKRRLIFDGDGTGDDRRLNVFLKMVSKWAKTEESGEENQNSYDKIVAQLALIENARRKSLSLTKSNDEQLKKYNEIYKSTESEIEKINLEIEKQRDELKKAKVIKHHRMQYNLLAKSIEDEPPRTDMIKKLDKLKKELEDLAAEKKKLDVQLDKRKKQFGVLVSSANKLSAILDDDDDGINDDDSNDTKLGIDQAGYSGAEAELKSEYTLGMPDIEIKSETSFSDPEN